jgi:phosphopantothenoylcysteine decarboxylase/phosphopantothenate--cysteine ligase
MEVVDITSAEEMYQAVTSRSDQMDIIIKAAAVADYRPAQVSDQKVKKKDGDLSIPLERTRDILLYLGSHKRPGQFLCGFSMETEHMIENSQKKLVKKNLDMIAANNVKVAGAGFGVDTNLLTLITPERITELPLLSKDGAADALLDAILEAMQ